MLNVEKLHLAADPDRPPTAAEKRYYSQWLRSLELPPTITVPTNRGGQLHMTSDGDLINLKVDGLGAWGFAVRFNREHFADLLTEGGCQTMPGVGRLIATPRGRDRVRICLLPERPGSKDWQGQSFEADLVTSEILAKL